ncbi:MAG: Zn-dependent protease [Pedosphaera sp.]|nr:Zn-dependent protease [Pedosphaera sp.]
MSCFLIVVVIWVFSVCLHEYGHAIVAYHGGDHTVEEKGYLSMNPVYYAHPVTSFLLPMLFMVVGGIGLPGGAVYINRHLLRSRGWETAVSLAGPAMNLIIAIIITLLLRFFLIPYYPTHIATEALAFALVLQFSAILFNLIPIPPLDGFQAIEPWLSQQWREHLLPMANYGMFVLFALFWYVEPFYRAFWSTVRGIISFLGVDPGLAAAGFHAFRFWQQ